MKNQSKNIQQFNSTRFPHIHYPVKSTHDAYDFELKYSNYIHQNTLKAFFTTPTVSTPLPQQMQYYTEDYDTYEKPDSRWRSVYSGSTLAESKQFDDSNSSSFVYDYSSQLPEEYYDYETESRVKFNEVPAQPSGNVNENDAYENNEYDSKEYEVQHDEIKDYEDGDGFYEPSTYQNDQVEPEDYSNGEYWAYSEGDHISDKNFYTDGQYPEYSEKALDAEDQLVEGQDLISRHNSEYYQSERKATENNDEVVVGTYPDVGNEVYGEQSEEPVADTNYLNPYTLEQIDERIEIRVVPGKGRCAFARMDYKPGDVIFVELPTLVATPDIDLKLWAILQQVHEAQPLELPPVWHVAAIYSLTKLSEDRRQVIFDKWVPDVNKPPSDDVKRVLAKTKINIDPKLYERALQVWRYNSFGHHLSSDGLVLYNRISMLSHNCAASASWHYGVNDAFTLRARQTIKQGEEISISYVGDEDILKAAHIRQEKLSGWRFKCACSRCEDETDTARGFRCPSCGTGSVFFKTYKGPSEYVTVETTRSSKCTLCKATPTLDELKFYLRLEDAYIARLAETSKMDLLDAEHVYSEAQRVFVQHWVLYQLDCILFEGYRDEERWEEALIHQSNRIRYVSQAVPEISYTLAWLYEELGDLHARRIGIASNFEQSEVSFLSLTAFQKNVLVDKYETAMNILLILCGPEHDYTIAAHEKLEFIFDLGKGCFGEEE